MPKVSLMSNKFQINNLQNEILAEPSPQLQSTYFRATRTVVMSKNLTHNPQEDFDNSNQG